MILKFSEFNKAIGKQFQKMSTSGLFQVNVDREVIWQTYLDAFPPGTDPIYKKKNEHDCNCCKSFIRNAGGIVTIIGNEIETIWDCEVNGDAVTKAAYQAVANAMKEHVIALAKKNGIASIFLHTENKIGTLKSNHLLENEPVKVWDHFHFNLPKTVIALKNKNKMTGEENIGFKIGQSIEERIMLEDALDNSKLSVNAMETVLELIEQGTVYRGTEMRHMVLSILDLKKRFDKIHSKAEKDAFCWLSSVKAGSSVNRIKNTAIGTLLEDLSNGMEIDDALKRYEKKMDAGNYKRPTATVTKKMLEEAQETVKNLGYETAIGIGTRRFMTPDDINVKDIIWKNKPKFKEKDVFDILSAKVPEKKKNLDKIEEMAMEVFLEKVVPKADAMEVLFENRLTRNLVTTISPVDATAKLLFYWDNNFSWSYNGDLADSEMRKAVQARGGSVTGSFRFTHQWNYDKRNASLMDLHVFMPGSSISPDNPINNAYGSGRRIGWNHRQDHLSSGKQDVDYVTAAPEGYIPVENITFPDLAKMPKGTYICKIHNWNLRQPTQGGFKAEIEFNGQIFQYEVDRPLKEKEWITVAEVTLEKDNTFTIKHHLPHGESSSDIWGITTNTYQKVTNLMLSPNHWQGKSNGNKHYMFILENCIMPGQARGFYNEMLNKDLIAHRKVFELVGAKAKTEESNVQVSGLGFSETMRNHVLVRVTGAFTRNIKVTF